jgi:hypothetical protein
VAILLARKDPESLVKCIDYWGCPGRIRGRNVNGTRSRGLEIGLVGVMLLWYDYNMLGVALGGAGIVAALLFQLLVRDPTVY